MTKSDFKWNRYYEEIDPERRKELLEIGCEQCPDENADFIRRRLWDLRYADPENSGRRVDLFLWQCVNLLCIYKTAGFLFTRRGAEKELQKARKTMGFELAETYGDTGKKLLYFECRNAIRRYFWTCHDKSYQKKLFGIASMKEDEWQDKIAGNAWQLAEGLPERLGKKEELALFSDAVRDEYFALYADGQTRWKKYQDKQKRRSA